MPLYADEVMGNLADKCTEPPRDDLAGGEFSYEGEEDGEARSRKPPCDCDYSDDFDDDDVEVCGRRLTVATVHRKGSEGGEVPRSVPVEPPAPSPPRKPRNPSIHSAGGSPMRARPADEEPRPDTSTPRLARQLQRLNMSFTNDRAREIHRENHILMKKLLNTKSSSASVPAVLPAGREPSAAIARRRTQQKTNTENLILLRKIQRAKPSNLSIRR